MLSYLKTFIFILMIAVIYFLYCETVRQQELINFVIEENNSLMAEKK